MYCGSGSSALVHGMYFGEKGNMMKQIRVVSKRRQCKLNTFTFHCLSQQIHCMLSLSLFPQDKFLLEEPHKSLKRLAP